MTTIIYKKLMTTKSLLSKKRDVVQYAQTA